jgi:hypothetical protein
VDVIETAAEVAAAVVDPTEFANAPGVESSEVETVSTGVEVADGLNKKYAPPPMTAATMSHAPIPTYSGNLLFISSRF